MNRIIKALAGQSTAKKYAVYAAMVTAALLVIALVVLAATSIAYSLADTGEEAPAGDGGDGGAVNTPSIEYKMVSEIDEAKLGGALVNIRNSRSELMHEDYTTPIYYAVKSSELQILEDVQEQLDAMLVAFYENNNSNTALNPEGANSGNECTMPMVCSPNKTVFELKVCKNDASIANDTNYSWIFTNAYKYGFITDGDTFTYVGSAAATYMKNKSVTSYDTFVSTLKANGDKNVAVSAVNIETGKSTTYQMYYIAAGAQLKVPANYDYFAIGNSTDGYVVTVNMSKKIAGVSTDTAAG